MDKSAVFSKTDDGREALTSRPPGLTPRLRSLLIMTDGKRTVAELDKMLGAEGAAGPLLEQLVAQGWVLVQGAPVVGAASVATGAVTGQAPAELDTLPPLVNDVWPFLDARRRVVRFINDQLGPMGETLAIRVESCKNATDLQAALPRIRDGLRNFKNSATVQQFDQEIAPHLPTA
ncbi:MAG: hypothetical protein Q8O50_07570 [Hydrogenophaga sp.]|nr:hypothetical protein [Hydrogenophaga sp.]